MNMLVNSLRCYARLLTAAATMLFVAALTSEPAFAADDAPAAEALAKQVLASLDQPTGLCVHLGLRDGRLTVELSNGGKYLVHGLSDDQAAVDAARKTIAAAKLSGVVSVERASLARLPYADHLVNVLVADDFPALMEKGLKPAEVLRVLQPDGTAWLGQPDTTKTKLLVDQLEPLQKSGVLEFELIKSHGGWIKLTAPRPKSMDRWTHRRKDAAGNPVSSDANIGVPKGIRWVAGPQWPTGYRKSAVPAVVASNRRLVYVFQDEVETPKGPEPQDSLIARDAYNGLRLWRRPADSTNLISVGDRVFTELDGKLAALNAHTGELLHTYDKVASPDAFFHVEGRLVVEGKAGVVCVDVEKGDVLWTYDEKPEKLLAGDGRVFVHVSRSRRGGDSQYVALDLATGKQQWAVSTKDWSKSSPQLIFYHDGVLVSASSNGNHAVSADDGSHLWDYSYKRIGHGGSYAKVMAMQGLVWVHVAGFEGKKQYAWEGLDPQKGKVVKRVVQPEGFSMKHRCSYDVATQRFFLCGSMDFADLETGGYSHFAAARNSCAAAGVVPANGMLYSFPHACGCYNMLRGFLALSSEERTQPQENETAARLEKGPAFGLAAESSPSDDDWPTYRHDTRRTGSTGTAGPGALEKLWERTLSNPVSEQWKIEWDQKDGGRLSSPVVAEGLAIAAASDDHRIAACDAQTGELRWTFTVGGRVDCPPSIQGGLCLFGSHDGWVYCLRAKDGQLVWRRRAAPVDRRVVAFGQLESPWPVTGGVLPLGDLAYYVIGRHTGSDGGLRVEAVKQESGELAWTNRPTGHDGVPDVLTGADDLVQMSSIGFDAESGEIRQSVKSRLRGGRLGLLNDAWYKRPIAMRRNLQAWTADGRTSGQMLAFNDKANAGYRACTSVSGGDGKMSGCALLFAEMLDGKGKWSLKMPTHARPRGMVLAQNALYVAGDLYNDETDEEPFKGVRAYRIADGDQIAQFEIADRLVHDCLAIAGGRVYVSTQTGKLICLGER